MRQRTGGRAASGRRVPRWTTVLAAVATAAATLGGASGAAHAAAAQPKLPKPPVVRDLEPTQRKDRKGGRNEDIPPSARPPAGMCRIWLDNVPPAQQPAPTDCGSAVRNRPANARVIFGDDYVRKSDGADAGGAGAVTSPPTDYAVLETEREPAAARGAERAHGPSAGGDAPWTPDSTARRPDAAVRPGAPPPASRPTTRPAGPERLADDWEAGYAAGYRDAMQGRRPRVRGVDRAAPADVGPSPDDAIEAVPGGYGSGAASGAYPGPARRGGVVGAGVGTAVVVPPGEDPRYFNNGRYAPPGRANGVCLDRDADGWCDDPRFGAPVCRDLDGDGRCDDVPALAAAPYPAALPDMRAGTDVLRGRGSATALRWLGTTEVVARVSDLRGTGAPSRVTWLDANTGALLQVWSDRDGDGVADRVEVYRGGRRVKLIGR